MEPKGKQSSEVVVDFHGRGPAAPEAGSALGSSVRVGKFLFCPNQCELGFFLDSQPHT